jgi:hypothetical protein
MTRVGMVPAKATNWKDMFVSDIHELPGS